MGGGGAVEQLDWIDSYKCMVIQKTLKIPGNPVCDPDIYSRIVGKYMYTEMGRFMDKFSFSIAYLKKILFARSEHVKFQGKQACAKSMTVFVVFPTATITVLSP